MKQSQIRECMSLKPCELWASRIKYIDIIVIHAGWFCLILCLSFYIYDAWKGSRQFFVIEPLSQIANHKSDNIPWWTPLSLKKKISFLHMNKSLCELKRKTKFSPTPLRMKRAFGIHYGLKWLLLLCISLGNCSNYALEREPRLRLLTVE